MAAVLHSQTQTIEAKMSRMMEAFCTQLGTLMPQGGHSAGPSQNELRFRDLGKFSGDEGRWSEWSLKFLATIKECDVALFQAPELACESEMEVTKAHVESISTVSDALQSLYSLAWWASTHAPPVRSGGERSGSVEISSEEL